MRVRLNVGGKIFETTDQTLLMNSDYFNSLFKKDYDVYFDDDGKQIKDIFIDRSPQVFAYILDYLRDFRSKIPHKYEYELEYYGIKYSDENISDNDIKKILKDFNEKMDDVIDSIKSVKNGLNRLEYHHIQTNRNLPKCTHESWTGTRCTDLLDCDDCERCDNHCNCDDGCWKSDVEILTSKGWIPSYQLNVNDVVIVECGKFAKIKQIYKDKKDKKKMVLIDGIELTHGHPVKYQNQCWYRPYEIAPITILDDIDLINLRLDRYHDVFLRKNGKIIIVATQGKFPPDWRK